MPKYIAIINDPWALLPVELLVDHIFETKEAAKQHGLIIVGLLATHMKIFLQIYELKSRDQVDFFVDNHKVITIQPHN